MTKKVTIKSNQTQLDLSIQEYGTVEAVMEFMAANNVSITDALIVGNELNVIESTYTNLEVLNYYKQNSILPATTTTQTVAGTIPVIVSSTTTTLQSKVVSMKHQSLLDIALQENGTVEAVMAICEANNLSLTTVLIPGTELDAQTNITDIEILTYYKRNNIKPATDKAFIVPVDGYAVSTYVLTNYWL